jgi:hypothetical protein
VPSLIQYFELSFNRMNDARSLDLLFLLKVLGHGHF